jgi:hypothetical protein
VRDKDKDGPTIGLVLCRAKNHVVTEYALRDIHKPVGVADLQLTRLLPERRCRARCRPWKRSRPSSRICPRQRRQPKGPHRTADDRWTNRGPIL